MSRLQAVVHDSGADARTALASAAVVPAELNVDVGAGGVGIAEMPLLAEERVVRKRACGMLFGQHHVSRGKAGREGFQRTCRGQDRPAWRIVGKSHEAQAVDGGNSGSLRGSEADADLFRDKPAGLRRERLTVEIGHRKSGSFGREGNRLQPLHQSLELGGRV